MGCLFETLGSRIHFSGSPIPTFGVNGQAGIAETSDDTEIAVQGDQKILVLTANQQNEIELTRLNRNGHLDRSFNGTGHIEVFSGEARLTITDLRISSDGGIVAAYSVNKELRVSRFKLNGHRDLSFATRGTYRQVDESAEYFTAVSSSVDKAGNIFVTGDYVAPEISDYQTFKLRADGTRVDDFGPYGSVTRGYTRTLIGPDDQLYGSTVHAYYRLNSADGSVDATFAQQGHITHRDSAYFSDKFDVGVDGSIFAMGAMFSRQLVLDKYKPNGALDSRFGTQGKALLDSQNDVDRVLAASGGEVFLSSRFNRTDSAILRFQANGQPDPNFGSAGVLRVPNSDVAIQYAAPSLALRGLNLLYGTNQQPNGLSRLADTIVGEISLIG